MATPLLHTQLRSQLSQWIIPQDKRHLDGFAENVAAILQSQSACLSHWLTYLSHRDCQARSQMERLRALVPHNWMPECMPEKEYKDLQQNEYDEDLS